MAPKVVTELKVVTGLKTLIKHGRIGQAKIAEQLTMVPKVTALKVVTELKVSIKTGEALRFKEFSDKTVTTLKTHSAQGYNNRQVLMVPYLVGGRLL